MRVLNKLTDEPKQNYVVQGEQGEQIPFYLEYVSTQNAWKVNISYGDWALNGFLLTLGPNVLRAYRNIIPFGLACYSTTGMEPLNIDDFSSGRILLYLLNREDVAEIESRIYS